MRSIPSIPERQWHQISVSPKVSKRSGHTMVKQGGNIYIYAGYSGETRLGDLHAYNIFTECWINLTPLFKGPIPSQREGHTAIVHNDRMVIFAGFDGKHTNQLFDLNLSTMRWTKYEQTSSTPVARYYHSAVKYKEKMYIFGGEDYRDSYLQDMHYLDLSDFTWHPVAQTGAIPSPRFFHSACVKFGAMYLFGGHNSKTCLNDLYRFDFESGQWSQIHATGQIPVRRSSHSVAILGNSMLLFGGLGFEGKSLNDIHLFHFQNQEWKKVQMKNEIGIRYNHRTLMIGNILYLFGGSREDKLRSTVRFNDFFLLKFEDVSRASKLKLSLERQAFADVIIALAKP